jgi:hypothetical protein
MCALLTEKGVEQIFQRAAAAQDARFHGAHATFQNLGNFFVA